MIGTLRRTRWRPRNKSRNTEVNITTMSGGSLTSSCIMTASGDNITSSIMLFLTTGKPANSFLTLLHHVRSISAPVPRA